MLAYFVVGHNANHFVHEKLAQLLPSNLICTFRKENFARKKNEKFKERSFAIASSHFAEQTFPFNEKDNK